MLVLVHVLQLLLLTDSLSGFTIDSRWLPPTASRRRGGHHHQQQQQQRRHDVSSWRSVRWHRGCPSLSSSSSSSSSFSSFSSSLSPLTRPITALADASTEAASIESVNAESLQSAFSAAQTDIAKTCKVSVGVASSSWSWSSSSSRLGLIATSNVKKGDTVLAIPYDDRIVLSPSLARNTVLKGVLPDGYDGWTGDAGLIALLILNEVVRASEEDGDDERGIPLPKRDGKIRAFMKSWVETLPAPPSATSAAASSSSSDNEEGTQPSSWHPLLWNEQEQEVLQSSSARKIYQSLDDLDEDASWLIERVWSKARDRFPESVTWNGGPVPCYTAEGFRWAMALSLSRSVFVDGELRLIPLFDACNHDDGGREIGGGFMGTFGTTKGAVLVASRDHAEGEEVTCSYGPKGAADYLMEHGFCPPMVRKAAESELTFEVDPEDKFYDDKMDILEFETYDAAPMDPVQSFTVVCEAGRDGEPDPAMIQFVRLCQLGGQDAFLLESIFRKEAWGFMGLPVSEMNELATVNAVIGACQKALDEFEHCPEGGPDLCRTLRETEARALIRTKEYLQREKEALDLKEYYQERRLKDLGLDTEWEPDEDIELGFGQTRVPGGADYDW